MPILHTLDGMPFGFAVEHYQRHSDDPEQPGGTHAVRFMVAAGSPREAKSLLGGIEPLVYEAIDRFGGVPVGTLEWDLPELRQLPAGLRADAERLAREVARARKRLILVRAWMGVEVPGCACP